MRFNPTLITGKVTDLVITKGKINLLASPTGQTAMGGGAAAAALTGNFFISSVLASGWLANQEGTFFSFKLNGIQISGAFMSIELQEGDEVDVVVEHNPQNNHEAIAYLVRLPKHRSIWIATGYDNPDMTWLVTRAPVAFVIFLLVIAVPFFIAVGYWEYGNLDMLIEHWLMWLLTFLGAGVVIGLWMALGSYIMFIPKAKRAAKVLSVLGYKEPKKAYLHYNSEQLKQQWQQEGKTAPFEDDEFVLYY